MMRTYNDNYMYIHTGTYKYENLINVLYLLYTNGNGYVLSV